MYGPITWHEPQNGRESVYSYPAMLPVSATITGRSPSPRSSRLFVSRPSGGRRMRYQATMRAEQAAQTSATSFSRSSIEWMDVTGGADYHAGSARSRTRREVNASDGRATGCRCRGGGERRRGGLVPASDPPRAGALPCTAGAPGLGAPTGGTMKLVGIALLL